MPISKNALVPALITPFFIWRIYRRVKREVGRQPLRSTRLKWYVGLLVALILALAAGFFRNPTMLAALAGGGAAGVLLGWLGLRLTRFEDAPDGKFYTPNAYLGVGVSLLLVGRFVYRMLLLAQADSFPASPAMQSPLTYCIFGLTVGYYVVYYAGVLWRLRSVTSQPVGT